jgi:hypothetical protein
MMAKVQGDVLDPRRFSPLITEEIRSALLTGLHRDPLQRPRSATAFCNLLKGSNSQQTVNAPKPTSHRNRVVVSYSHHDSDWLERVRVHLRPLEREQSIEFWDDTRIQPGQNWRDEIANSLEAAACAILIVSSHFLASDFCSLEEVPRLLRTARDRGVTILPLIVSPCRFEQASGISVFQSVNPPSRTLAEMTDPECDRTLLRLAEAVQKAQQEK